MNLKPLPHFFIVKVNIEEQKNRKEKIGSLYLHFNEIQMQRNMQNGIVEAIGDIANKNFPEVEVGNILIFHHFVEVSNFITSDGTYNYYNVTACEWDGHRNESYAVFKEEKLIPHSDFVFIQTDIKEEFLSEDEFIDKSTKKVGSLILFDNWEEKREDKEAKAHAITAQIKNASKGKLMSDDSKRAIEELQNEAAAITMSLNKKEYKPYKVYAANPSLNVKDDVYAMSIAASTTIEFMNVEYTVIPVKYIAATA